MRRFFCAIIIFCFCMNVAAQSRSQLITMRKGSNIYAKTMLFYLPLTHSKSLEHCWTLNESYKTFDSVVSIDGGLIYNKPIIGDIFASDFFLRIQQIPFKNIVSGKIILPVTIRVNQTVITRDVLFSVKSSNGRMRLVGKIKNLRISDIKKENNMPKRERWKVPILIDMDYDIKNI